jgi:hypothetical protein
MLELFKIINHKNENYITLNWHWSANLEMTLWPDWLEKSYYCYNYLTKCKKKIVGTKITFSIVFHLMLEWLQRKKK